MNVHNVVAFTSVPYPKSESKVAPNLLVLRLVVVVSTHVLRRFNISTPALDKYRFFSKKVRYNKSQ